MAEVKRKSSMSARVLKVMGIFSGVQVMTVLCSVLRTKLVAVILGPAGIGLYGLYNTALETINAVAQMGMGVGGVRMMSQAPKPAVARVATIIRRYGLFLGVCGAVLTAALSPLLSRLTFGDSDHTLGFIVLSVAVLFCALSSTEGIVFQGLAQYRKLGASTVAGAVAGLVLAVPLYYIWGLNAIVPSILVITFASWVCRGLYRENTGRLDRPLTIRDTAKAGRSLATLGIYITITDFAANGVGYLFMSYLNREAGTDMAGLYQGGFTMVSRYTGLVLMALAMEFMPRLSASSHSDRRVKMFLTHEITLLMPVMLLMVTLFICLSPQLVELLFDKRFLAMLPYITVAIVGTVLRAWAMSVALVILARGNGALYLVTELLSACVALAANVFFYRLYGIPGLGWAYIVWYLFYLVEVQAAVWWRYRIAPSAATFRLAGAVFALCLAASLCRIAWGWVGALPFVLLAVTVAAIALPKLLGKKFVKPTKKA